MSDAVGLIVAAKPVISVHEGERLHVYEDILGIPTIGIGFNLDNPNARQLCANCGANYDRLVGGVDDLTPEQSDYLYQQMAMNVLEWQTALFPALFSYTQKRQVAVLDMGYNLGETRFKGFRGMISAILAGDWPHAGGQALSSLWATQVGERATQDALWLAEG